MVINSHQWSSIVFLLSSVTCHCCSFDGIVVAKEFEEIIMDAWQTEEQITIEKEMKVN